MALTISGVGDCRAALGPSQWLRAYQLQPGANDYPKGGYPITAGAVDLAWLFGAWIIGVDAAGTVYKGDFVLPSGSFGTTPAPSQSINFVVSQPVGGGGLISQSATVSVTNSALTGNVATFTAANTFKAGQFVILQGLANALATAMNGILLQIVTANATTFTVNFTHANITSGAETATAATLQVPGNGPVTPGATIAVTNSALASNIVTITCANSFVPGELVVLQGLANAGATALNGQVVQVLTANATTFTAYFTHANISTGAETTATVAPLTSLGVGPITVGTPMSVTNTVLTSNVASISAVQNFVANEFVIMQGLTNGAVLNGIVFQVISTGLTNALFEFNYTHANVTTGADAGTVAPLIAPSGSGFAELPAGTNLSGISWICEFLGY